MQYLVQVRAYADVRVIGHQRQGLVARGVEAPGGNGFLRYSRAFGLQALHRIVGGACVQHVDRIRFRHGLHPSLHKTTLVLADSVDVYIHFLLLSGKLCDEMGPSSI